MPCAGSSAPGRRGGCCPTTSPAGRRSTNRPSTGSRPAASRPLSRICASCCGWPRDATPSSRRPSSTVRPCRAAPRAGRAPATTGTSGRKGSKLHLAVDTLGHLLALHVTPANEQDRAQVGVLAEAVQEATGEHVELGYVDQGCTGQVVAEAAAEHGLELHVVKLEEAKQGFVLLPHRWVAERSCAWKSRFRRLVRDYEWLPETVKGLHHVAANRLPPSRSITASKDGSASRSRPPSDVDLRLRPLARAQRLLLQQEWQDPLPELEKLAGN